MIFIALAMLAANPSTITSVIATAKPGDVVRLVAGKYPPVVVRGRTFDPAMTIDASDATVAEVVVQNSTGLRWIGGTMAGDPSLRPAEGNGFVAQLSSAITVSAVHFSDLRTAIVYDRVSGGEISGNLITRMSTDGIDIALSRGLLIAQNACSDFERNDASHPDCIQLWSRPTSPPVADVTITGNTSIGAMQGISLFNHVRNGVDDGGFDRITIADNNMLTIYSNGIAAYECRGCTIRGNTVASLPNYINIAQLYVSGGSVEVCGNTVPRVPRQAGPPCP